MSTAQSRDRVSVSVTPRLAAIISRHAHPGEPRAATVARLIERADTLDHTEPASDDLTEQHLAALDDLAGTVSYPDDYLDDLRSDWDERP